jgi:translation elongation factor P/translation initiation factor 5A
MFVIYHTATRTIEKTYVYEASAVKYLAKMGAGYSLTDIDTFRNTPVPMMKVRSLMSGEMVEIPADTPWCCNPASETYWSM